MAMFLILSVVNIVVILCLKANEYNALLMFETQSTDEWLPGWARRFRPLLISLFITPIAIIIGGSDWGPEGPQVYVGFLIFPYAALLYFAGVFTQNVGLLYVSIALALMQFPVYGIVLSWFDDTRRVAKVILFLHLGTGVFVLGILLSIWFYTFPPDFLR